MTLSTVNSMQVIEDALAFERGTLGIGIDAAVARKVAAMLGELNEAQARRICLAARDQQRAERARLERRTKRAK